jgi:hypothetical protein
MSAPLLEADRVDDPLAQLRRALGEEVKPARERVEDEEPVAQRLAAALQPLAEPLHRAAVLLHGGLREHELVAL